MGRVTIVQRDAMRCLARLGWRTPNQAGFSVQVFRALEGHGLIRHTAGNGNDSIYELTDDGRAWVCANMK